MATVFPANNKSTGDKLSYEEFVKWTPEQLTNHLKERGAPVGDKFIRHRIDGSLVGLLTDKNYETIGFEAVGDMLRVQICVSVFQKEMKAYQRDHIIWEAESYRDKPCYAKCCVCFKCCYDFVPPNKYKLTSSNLQVIQFSKVNSNPCVASCYPTKRSVDNIALAHVKDVDVDIERPGCFSTTCCGLKGVANVILSHAGADSDGNTTTLVVRGDTAMEVQKMLRDAIADNNSKI
jgi:hypothetical protein